MNVGLHAFLGGLVTMCFAAIGLCFSRYWTLHRDPLFISFSIAFGLLATNQGLVVLMEVPQEELSWIYLLRVAAFLIIAMAIVRKNVSQDR